MKSKTLAFSLTVSFLAVGLHAEDPQPGYLSKQTKPKVEASKLRFAPPAKPTPKDLPPLPVSPDPQPVHPPEYFMEIAGTLKKKNADSESKEKVETQVAIIPVPAAPGVAQNQQNLGQLPLQPLQQPGLPPQMLLKLSPHGKLSGYEFLANPGLIYSPYSTPIPPSSATYTVK